MKYQDKKMEYISLKTKEGKKEIKKIGLSKKKVLKTLPERSGLADRITRWILILPLAKKITRWIRNSYRNKKKKYQHKISEEGAIRVNSLFSNKKEKSNDYILINKSTIAYRFGDKKEFWLIHEQSWLIYIPSIDTIISPDNTSKSAKKRRKKRVSDLKKLTKNEEEKKLYVGNENNRRSAAILGMGNFAHHLCNELQGIERFIQSGDIEKVNKIIVNNYPLGKIEDIFEAVESRKIYYVRDKERINDIINDVRSIIPFKINDKYVSESLKNKVIENAINKCSKMTKKKIELVENRKGIKIWISIKIGGRTLSNQTSVLSKLIKELYDKSISNTILVDAVSYPKDDKIGGRIFKKEFVKRHEREIEKVKKSVSSRGVKIINMNGNSLLDSIAWAQVPDFYVTHWGTIQHKVGWLSDCPGLVHANELVLNNKWRHLMFSRSIGDYSPTFLKANLVRDVESDVQDSRPRGSIDLSNYYVDEKMFSSAVINEIRKSNIE